MPDHDVSQLVIMIILIPLPLFFAETIFGVRGLEAYVIIGIIWAFCSSFMVVIYPLYESRLALSTVLRGVVKVRALASLQFCTSRLIVFFVRVFFYPARFGCLLLACLARFDGNLSAGERSLRTYASSA